MGAKKLEGICLPAFGCCQQLRMVCGLVHISEMGLPTSFTQMGIPADTDFRAVADSTNVTAGCCKKLTHDEIYEILQECI